MNLPVVFCVRVNKRGTVQYNERLIPGYLCILREHGRYLRAGKRHFNIYIRWYSRRLSRNVQMWAYQVSDAGQS